MSKKAWNKLSAEEKLKHIEGYLESEIDRLDKLSIKTDYEATRSYCVRTIIAYQDILHFMKGELFDE